MPGAPPCCSTPTAVGLVGAEGTGVAVAAIVWVGVGEADAAGIVVARGLGVALGTRSRPRRCEAVGNGDAEEIGVDVAAAAGVWVAATVADGTGVAAEEVDVVEPASVVELDALVALTNFLDGAFEGGGASDFIFSRAFLAPS